MSEETTDITLSTKDSDKQNNKSKSTTEEFKVQGKKLWEKLKEIISEGNARRIIVRNDKGKDILVIPVTFGVVGVVLAPYAAAVGAIAAFATNCSIIVEKG